MKESGSRHLVSGILMFHKPKSVVVSRVDERGRKTIYDVLPVWVRDDGWVPVGRLDRDSRGLLLLVKDRSLVELLGAPGRHLKTYEVWVRGRLTDRHLELIRNGVPSPVGVLTCKSIEIIGKAGPKQQVRVVLDEGKNRHLRRMFGALQDEVYHTPLKVLELKRTGFGDINLDVSSSNWRFLTDNEIRSLCISP